VGQKRRIEGRELGISLENTRYEYSAITQRLPFRWPNGERVAVWDYYDIERFRVAVPQLAVSGSLSKSPCRPSTVNDQLAPRHEGRLTGG